jgi:hypothetical protein
VFVAGHGSGPLMQVLRRGHDLSLISCLRAPSPQLFAAIEVLGRVKHVFRLDSDSDNDDAEWVTRFAAVYWAPTAGRGVDCLLTREVLLPFPGRVWVFEAVARSEVVLFVSALRLVIAGRSVPVAPEGNDAWLVAQRRPHPQPRALASDYEALITGLRFERVLTPATAEAADRTQVVRSLVAINDRGMLAGTVGRPFSRWRSAPWFVLFLLQIVLLFLYLVSRGGGLQ